MYVLASVLYVSGSVEVQFNSFSYSEPHISANLPVGNLVMNQASRTTTEQTKWNISSKHHSLLVGEPSSPSPLSQLTTCFYILHPLLGFPSPQQVIGSTLLEEVFLFATGSDYNRSRMKG